MPYALRLALLTLVTSGMWCASLPAGEPLPGTAVLVGDGDFASDMVDGIDRFLLAELEASVEQRAVHWNRDTSSGEAYNASVAGNRQRLREIIGTVDERTPFDGLELVASTSQEALVGRGEKFEAFAVRWPVFRGITGEGLLLKPTGGEPVACCVALPDADQTPEMLAGLTEGLPADSQFARRLAESGCLVVVPMLIDRTDAYSITTAGRGTNQPHREFVYRPAFEMGRHVIGYEVQKVLAVVDWFAGGATAARLPIGVAGYGEGGLLRIHAAALDPRIDAALVSGYFGPREGVWQEPIYRNVFSLLDEFGDAELATLVYPRDLFVEVCPAPAISGPPAARTEGTAFPPRVSRGGAAPGRIASPTLEEAQQELTRAFNLLQGPLWGVPLFHAQAFGSEEALDSFFGSLVVRASIRSASISPTHLRKGFDPQPRLKRQLDQLLEDTQHLMREAEYVRRDYWSRADRGSLDKFIETTRAYRDELYNDVIGRFDRPLLPANARSRQVYDEPKYVGYEVQMDVFPDVFAYGILLVPKDMQPGERRPVVVCQHGLEGRPQDVADPQMDSPYYHQFANRLTEQGFITYSPQNPYIFHDRFRTLQRKLNPLKKTLYSVIVPQHQQTVDWLVTLPFVDPERIAFYGLSYGGKTAMRVPALVERYCLSICSGDFNEWIWKNVSLREPFTYPATPEYEIFEFNLGNTFNYAEMAALIAPRPFMVERGHRDGVGIDPWVNYEYAKVRLLYVDLKIPELTTIEHFDGPHEIHGVGTFEFLREQLGWQRE